MNLAVVLSRLETFSLRTQSNCDTQKAEGFGETGAGVDGEIHVSKALFLTKFSIKIFFLIVCCCCALLVQLSHKLRECCVTR